ncbi:FkbM family methyltransferase [Nostoc sp.]|uniref:FkbM family methyltransferase n=1 Tax=Nostoc sp. TaxID=1180 RepID=UPI002FFA2527
MKPYKPSMFNKTAKVLARPLSMLVANSRTESFARLAEAYWCVLLGKGSGSGWAFDTEINAAKNAIKTSSPILFDVGANIGKWSFQLNKLFPQAQIFMFEPLPNCQQIIKTQNITNSLLIPCAVSSTKGLVRLHTPSETSPIASLHQRYDSYSQDKDFTTIEVNTVTIDDIIEEYKIERVDFMKMDIEGHELDALQGAKKSLKNKVIRALTFEFGIGNINSRTYFRDFYELLSSLDYQIYRILPSSQLMHIKEYYEDCEYFRGATNYVAIVT